MTSFFDLRSDRDICTSRIHFPDLPAPGGDEYSVFKHIPVQAGNRCPLETGSTGKAHRNMA